METQPVLVRATEVRRRCGNISEMTLSRWVDRGILPPPLKIAGRNYWPESAVLAVQRGDRNAANDSNGGAA